MLFAGGPQAGQQTHDVDGRELWMLAEKYEVDGVKRWLLKHAITLQSVCAAAQFACMCVEGVCDDLLKACQEYASWSLPRVQESDLVGVGLAAATELLRGYVQNEYLGRACEIAEGFKFVQKWAAAQRSMPGHNETDEDIIRQARSLCELVELERLPNSFLFQHVKLSGFVGKERLWSLFEASQSCDKDPTVVSVRDHANFQPYLTKRYRWLAMGGRGVKERMAIVDVTGCAVHVFQFETMQHIWSVGRKGEGEGEFVSPYSAAFDGHGQLIVSDMALHRILVFDAEGKYVRSMGKPGEGMGELKNPTGIAVSSEGHIIVCDTSNGRVQIFSQSGNVVRQLSVPGESMTPYSVAVCSDGKIVIADWFKKSAYLFDSDGTYVNAVGGLNDKRSSEICCMTTCRDRMFVKCHGSPLQIVDWTSKPATVLTQEVKYSLVCVSSKELLVTC